MSSTPCRPFENPYAGSTPFKNVILDHIMPRLSPNGWKILCVAIRQTWGWVDEDSPTGRKESDRISYSQFMDKSGIKSRPTAVNAVKECLKARYLIRHQSGTHPGTRKPLYTYALNVTYELAGIEIKPAPSLEIKPENEDASLKNELAAGLNSKLTKEKEIEEENKGNEPIAANAAPKPKRKPSGKNAIKEELTALFSEMTAIPLPALETKAQGKAAGVQWFNPLLAIYAVCGNDLKLAREVIQEAIKQMDASGLTICSPKSIEKVAVGIAGRCKRDQDEKAKRAELAQQHRAQSEAIQAQRQADADAVHPDLKKALDVWRSACRFLSGVLEQDTYAIYVKPLEVLKPNGTFRLKAPDDNIREWLDKRLRRRVEDALLSAVGREVTVEFV